MGPKAFAVLALWILAVILFVLEGFDLVNPKEFGLIAIGLASFVAGMILNTFVTSP